MSRRDQTSKLKLKCGLKAPAGGETSLHTPNTPEILNTIVNITETLGHPTSLLSLQPHPLQSPLEQDSPSTSTPTPTGDISVPVPPASCPVPAPDYHSQFVKEGLKMKVRRNIRRSSSDSQSSHLSIKRESEDFIPENDEKRKRRRERNKIAAEKCRNKRKAAVEKLYSESETVAIQNSKYKEDIAKLEAEQRHLLMILEQHRPICRRLIGVKSSPDSIQANIAEVKTEKEDPEVYTEREENYENVFKYSVDLFDAVHNNFAYTGSYYDTACLAI